MKKVAGINWLNKCSCPYWGVATCKSIGNLSYYNFFSDGARCPKYKTLNGIKIGLILFKLFKKNQSNLQVHREPLLLFFYLWYGCGSIPWIQDFKRNWNRINTFWMNACRSQYQFPPFAAVGSPMQLRVAASEFPPFAVVGSFVQQPCHSGSIFTNPSVTMTTMRRHLRPRALCGTPCWESISPPRPTVVKELRLAAVAWQPGWLYLTLEFTAHLSCLKRSGGVFDSAAYLTWRWRCGASPPLQYLDINPASPWAAATQARPHLKIRGAKN